VDVVFDVYRDFFIKSTERELKGESDAITFKEKVKQFNNFLRNSDNSVVEHWLKTPNRKRLEDKELHATCGNRCYKITAERVVEEEEEDDDDDDDDDDTRLLLHAANEQRYRSINVSSEDTDVRVLRFAFSFCIDVPIYQCWVSQLNAQYVDIGKIAHDLRQDACKSLPGLHAFMSCQ